MSKPLTIIGCGPGAREYLTPAGSKAIAQADTVAGSAQMLEVFASEAQSHICLASDIEGALDALATCLAKGRRVAVLVSGDPGLCSLATPVIQRFGLEACEVIPGISSVQVAFARLGLDWTEARIISAHKSLPTLSAEELESVRTLVILCGHHASHQWIAELFLSLGQGRRLIVCQELSLPSERIDIVGLETFRKMELSSRTIVVIT